MGRGREEEARLDGWGSGMRERRGGRTGWMVKWDEGEKRGQGWMYGAWDEGERRGQGWMEW